MSSWICCNSCFMSPGPERQLAVTNCGHVICNICFQRGNQGVCLICKAKCQISPLSDKSSSGIQELFSDVNAVAVKYSSEISMVLQFQARHHKRLLAHYQQEENFTTECLHIKVRDDCSKSKFKTGITVQPRFTVCKSKTRADNIKSDSRGLSHKPDVLSRICLRSSPQNCRIGSVPHMASSQSTMGSAPFSATVSREFSSGPREPAMSPSHNVAYHRNSPWVTPVFKLPSAYKYSSVSSQGPPP
ncbi:probable E3 SUMO-protein ligase RNF212 isoform X3 [Pseudorasbora parva]|uniref:probable E3 SUMO-protein ligase RNF212 isoform X3 n=1 Tax=Pseudorasbora parva TaxID=51549 RepID=UPI00351E7070